MQQITDLEEIVRKWAWKMWDTTESKDNPHIPRKAVQFNINWNLLRFHFDTPRYDPIPFVGTTEEPSLNEAPPKILFRSCFSNCTAHDQEYIFKTERTTRSCATVNIEQGFTRGCDFALKLTPPCKILEANAGFKQELSVKKIGEEKIEEEMRWGVESTVTVPKHTEATAELVITEDQCQAKFTMKTKFHGKILVTVTNLKDNNNLVTILEGNIGDMIAYAVANDGLTGFSLLPGKVVVAETRGKCHFRFGVEQKVRIDERPLTGKEKGG